MEMSEMQEWEYYTEEDKKNNEITLWRVMDIDSNEPMMAVAYKKDGMNESSLWEDYLCRILPDGTPNVRLNTVRRMIAKIKESEKREKFSITSGKSTAFAVGKNNFPFMMNNYHKQILINNGITIAPYIRALIENDLKEKGLL